MSVPRESPFKGKRNHRGQIMLILPEVDYLRLSEDGAGLCLACGHVEEGDWVEPDAQGRRCSECDEMKVVGLEQALLTSHIDFPEEGG